MIRIHCLRVQRRIVARRTARQIDLRQPKIQYLGVTTLRDKNIGGLDISVNDPLHVSSVQRVGYFNRQRQYQLGLQRTPCDAMLQRHSVQKLHGDEGLSALIINLVNGADVWMIQSGRSLRFALESGQSLRILGYFIGQEFQGDETMQLHVLGLVDDTHATAAELLDDAVVRDG